MTVPTPAGNKMNDLLSYLLYLELVRKLPPYYMITTTLDVVLSQDTTLDSSEISFENTIFIIL